MSAAGLVILKRRIESIKKTRKITRAMGLVATSKLRKSRNVLVGNKLYFDKISSIFREIIKYIPEDNIYVGAPKDENCLYVVFTSDKGLCGSYNNYVVNKMKDIYIDRKEKCGIFLIGQRGKGHFERLNFKIISGPWELSDLPTVEEVKAIINSLVGLYKSGEVSEINLVYTKFITTVKTEIIVERLLPFERENAEGDMDYTIFEPSFEEVFEEIANAYLKEKIYYAAINAKSSEHSARMRAMDGATQNANDLLGKLQLKYNRIRQSSITQEISEIVGGSEAQR
ncbi:MAG: ATP synthase F1 subunit gamma [Clostridiales bacterium]|uniref:ATP synthase F1 subunit gamma n=1 Tax=Clostridium sp. N3C TaxID=1776758 RepID=UPI00092E02E1|nr:ATP synthase F1 subunit gamma [Clostridium sp. N3C]NLZ47278.1 ATP synthase F1 subunit gamma [Clostridiales bacterium]SCN23908.1 F-ATPase gamma subunit [Clostridium sp. N3C]